MKKYSEITLNDEEKKVLDWLKSQDYTHIGRSSNNGFIEAIDNQKGFRVNLKPMRKPFEFIEKGERYEIDKLLNPPKEPKTVWDLEDGDALWWISSSGFIDEGKWNSACFNIDSRNQGNVFLTEEEAKFESKRREVLAKVKKYARPFRRGRPNWYACFGYDTSSIYFCAHFDSKSPMLYFDSNEMILKAIDEVGEEDFKKYYLGVVEDHDRK